MDCSHRISPYCIIPSQTDHVDPSSTTGFDAKIDINAEGSFNSLKTWNSLTRNRINQKDSWWEKPRSQRP